MNATVGYAVFLVMYGNATTALALAREDIDGWVMAAANLAVMAASLIWAYRSQRLTAPDVGLMDWRTLRGSTVGLLAGLLVAAPAALYFRYPIGAPGGSVDYAAVRDATAGSFLLWALVSQPISTAAFEEVTFRGVLQALGVRTFGPSRGVLLTAASFCAWHVVISAQTLAQTSYARTLPAFAAAEAVSLLAVGTASLVFSALRLMTGGLAAPIVAHWVVPVTLQGALVLASG